MVVNNGFCMRISLLTITNYNSKLYNITPKSILIALSIIFRSMLSMLSNPSMALTSSMVLAATILFTQKIVSTQSMRLLYLKHYV